MCDRWSCQPSKAQPFITLVLSTHTDDYEALGFKLTCPPSSSTIQGMADICSLQIIRKLGISEKDLIPVTKRMHAANKQNIKILGAVIVRLSGQSKAGRKLQTRQILYVTDSADKLFISREACTSLGMISEDFPAIGEMASLYMNNQSSTICECPRRRQPPPRPTALPFPATQKKCTKAETVSTQLLPFKHIQYMRTPVPTTYGRSSNETHG